MLRSPSPRSTPSSIARFLKEWGLERLQLWRRALRDVPLVVLFSVAVAGILFAEGVPLSLEAWASWASFLGVATLLFYWIHAYRSAIAGVLLTTATLFAWMHAGQREQADNDPTLQMVTQAWSPVVFEGVVDSLPRWRPDVRDYERGEAEGTKPAPNWHTILEIRMTAVRDGQHWRSASGRIAYTAEANLRDFFPGQKLRIYGKWQRIPSPSNPGQFDLAKYYRRKGLHVRARSENAEQLQRLEVVEAWRLDRWLAMLLERGDTAMHRYVILGQDKLASALVLGQREQVEWELQESLLATGTMHMLAISGLHVEMVAISIVTLALLFRVPRKPTLLITAILVVGYGILCGGQPPVLRAVVLVVAVCAARWLGRRTHAINLLALAGLVLLWMRTSNLFDVGTQLSFLAVAMLAILAMHSKSQKLLLDPLQELLYETSPWWTRLRIDIGQFCWESIRTSAWVWMVTAPLILSTFHVISPIAILLNLILWLPLLVALLSGLGILVLGTWIPWVGMVCGWICGLCLAFTDWVIQGSEKIPGSHFWFPAPSLEWTMAFYGLLLVLWTLLGFQRSRRWISIICLALWSVGGMVPTLIQEWTSTASHPNAPKLQVTVIDVGHGSAILLQMPSGETWLYDAGRMGDQDRSFMPIASVLWHEGLRRLDGMILSHADADHYNAMSGIAKRFSPQRFITTEQVLSHSSLPLRRLCQRLQSDRVELALWASGGGLESDGVRLAALHPPIQGVSGSDNANSLCIELEFAGRRILLTGDLESPGTDHVIQQPKRKCDVLLAPHHGSLSQSPKPLLEWCHPDWVIISGGPRAVSPKVLEAYQTLNPPWITHRDGAIRIEVDSTGNLELFHWTTHGWESCMMDRSLKSP